MLSTPAEFTTNQSGDLAFLETLNGHPLADSCQATPAAPGEAPSSRPTTAGGVLYASFYASGNADLLVGGQPRRPTASAASWPATSHRTRSIARSPACPAAS